MDILPVLTYTAFCVAIFKVFKTLLNQRTVPTAVLRGIAIIGALLAILNDSHPYSEAVRQYFVTTPIIPEVRGRVVEVPVQSNTPIKKGDVLYRIDTVLFEDEIRGLEGELLAARKDLGRSKEQFAKQVASKRTLDQARARVDELQAKLDDAKFSLAQTVVKAPSDGFVSQLGLRSGMMALPLAFNPVMTFVHQEERTFFGWFRQISLLRLEPEEAEVTLDGIPGVIFKGKVKDIMPIIGEGQLKPRADFLRFDQERNPGRVPVAIKIDAPRL